jgi:hypothetical protein
MPTIRAFRSMLSSLPRAAGRLGTTALAHAPVLVLCTSRRGHPDGSTRPAPDGAPGALGAADGAATCGGTALAADRFTHVSGRGR